MSNSSNKFPPPLKEALPSDASQGYPATVVYREHFPWELYPSGTAVIVLGANQGYPPPPPPPSQSLPASEDDNYGLERRNLSYLNFILSSWQRGAMDLALKNPARSFPTYDAVLEMNEPTHKFIEYDHAGIKWRSSYRVKIEHSTTKLIVHLANDGFLYFNPEDVEVDKVSNDLHKKTYPSGWKVFKTGDVAERVKEQLSDFKAFAVAWFGSNSIRQSVLYNPQSWRIDICFKSKVTHVGLEFSFKPDSPVPDENYWWD
jgi:hypothetical protein